MNVKIKIEQYDNGISLKWNDCDNGVDPVAIVSLDEGIHEAIGKMIWEDIRRVMDFNLCNAVEMTIGIYPKNI